MGIARTLIHDEKKAVDPGFLCRAEIMDMIKVLSHDVRSPLITIAAGLKLLKKGAYGTVEKGVIEELKKLYEIVIKTAGNMEDFMERAFFLEGDLDSSSESLDISGDVLGPVLCKLQKEIREREVYFKNGISFKGFYVTVGNRFLLKAVFRNLLRNGLKYGGKGCAIYIDIDERGSMYEINVYNSGRPVPMEKRKMLFSKFCRIDKRDKRNPEGMGLGLYLVKEILVHHGGSIWYEPEEDGSNFKFTLPKYKKQLIVGNSFRELYADNNRLVSACPLSA